MDWKKILVIEDDLTFRSRFYEIFFNKGQEVHCVPTAKEAFAVLMEKRFDLILLDYSLPDAKAAEIIKKIREFDNDVKIILLYAEGLNDQEIRSLQGLTVDVVIKKDFSTHFMMKTILEFVRFHTEEGLSKSPLRFA